MLIDFRTPRVAVLCSKQAPGLADLLRHPSFGALYEVAAVITTEEELPEAAVVESAGVPLLHHRLRTFHLDRRAEVRDRRVRAEFDSITAGVLQRLGVDVVLLLGYLYVVTDPMLDAFPERIFNIHDSDLTLAGSDGRRRYTGLHATRDAIMAGESETRSTLHVVTADIDAGPIVARSDAFPVAPLVRDALALGALDMIRAYAYAHREWMMRRAWGSLAVGMLEQLACGYAAVAV